ncbi:unnamed protein product [Acanthoscelides obtectus]|uniref:Cytochrome P450 n=1 Tax=Acanthoscelides obtectus TaxID=200917 RepID=A0A9P0LJA1_ACAOB|nr:unnamed protein product [Acanthoscelides obtectus]CAK1677471.1 Probable cytochrome P450 9f2 [Acanthoscelides obtectus]
MIGVLVGAVTVILCICLYLHRRYTYWVRKNVKQLDTTWILGNNDKATLRQESFADMVKRVYDADRGERYTGIYQMSIPTLLIRDIDLLKQVCVKDFDHFVDHMTFIPDNCDPLWAKNLFALKGQRWKEMRPILSPSFTSSKMRAMFLLMSDCAKRFTQFFADKNDEIVELEMKDSFTRYCNDVIATCAFGIECDSLRQPNNAFYVMGKRTTNFSSLSMQLKFIALSAVPWLFELLKIPIFDDEIKQFFYSLVNDTIKTREEKGIVRPDMIHLLMEARKGETKQEEDNVIDTGFSTVQESNALKETLRKWPNAVAVDRVCTKPYTVEPSKPGEIPLHLKENDVLWIPIYGLHHDYRYFPHPERFDPERFSDENKDKIIPYTYLPFGCGPRNCIGSRFALLETKAVFFHLLTQFEIVPTNKTQIPLKLDKTSFAMVAENGFWVGLKKLNQ